MEGGWPQRAGCIVPEVFLPPAREHGRVVLAEEKKLHLRATIRTSVKYDMLVFQVDDSIL